MVEHFDRCLGCMACVTACPSGVQYDRLIEQVRPQLERSPLRSRRDRLHRAAIFALFTHPGRLRAMVPALAASSRLRVGGPASGARCAARGSVRCSRSRPDVALGATTRRLATVTPPARRRTTARGRVAFMQGCIQRVLFGDVNAATVRVLAAEGWEVHAPRPPALLRRAAAALRPRTDRARVRAARPSPPTRATTTIAVNVAGCGSAMKDYGHLLADDPRWKERAAAFSAKVRDVHELLDAHRRRRRPGTRSR